MSSEETLLSEAEFKAIAARIQSGEKAKDLWEQYGAWLDTSIFAALHDEALAVLRKATSDEQRQQAQHMSLAVMKFRGLIHGLINQANAARAELESISTQTEGENHG